MPREDTWRLDESTNMDVHAHKPEHKSQTRPESPTRTLTRTLNISQVQNAKEHFRSPDKSRSPREIEAKFSEQTNEMQEPPCVIFQSDKREWAVRLCATSGQCVIADDFLCLCDTIIFGVRRRRGEIKP